MALGTYLKIVPEGEDAREFSRALYDSTKEKMNEDEDYAGRHCDTFILTVAKFEQEWEYQENWNQTPENKDKLLELTKLGRVVVLERER
jgi:hypothetical protein